MDCAGFQPEFSRPLRDGVRTPLKLYPPNVSFVVCLFYGVRPSTITGFVIAVVVAAVDALSIWARTHVGEEGFVTIAPLIANNDPASAIVWKVAVIRI